MQESLDITEANETWCCSPQYVRIEGLIFDEVRVVEAAPATHSWIAIDNLAFNDYADFILAYPGFPRQEKMQRRAEAALAKTAVPPTQVIAFFDRNPPLTNPGRSAYALALASLQRPEATETSRSAWRASRSRARTGWAASAPKCSRTRSSNSR